jgi:predicted N-acyltransferase
MAAEEWNRLAGDNPFFSHGWLLSCELCWLARAQPVYFTWRRDGNLMGGAVCHRVEPSPTVETLDDMLLGRLRPTASRLGVSFLPALVCGSPQGYGRHIGFAEGLSPGGRAEVVTALLNAMEAEADRLAVRLSFVQTLESEPELITELRQRRYLECRNVPVAVLDVTWKSMDEYFADIPARRRRVYRRERRRNLDAGVSIRPADPAAVPEPRFRELIDANARQYGAAGMPFSPPFLRELVANMGESALLLEARQGEVLIGAHLALRQGRALAAFAIGVDPELGGENYTYFELGYYSMIERAIGLSIERIYFGRGMEEVKTRRGCRLEAASIFSRVGGPRRLPYGAWFKMASTWNTRKLSGEKYAD